jgi:hypothetical protein
MKITWDTIVPSIFKKTTFFLVYKQSRLATKKADVLDRAMPEDGDEEADADGD